MPELDTAQVGSPHFATTHWSVVQAAREGDGSQAAPALETLCQAYWFPLYAYVRRKGHSPEDAQQQDKLPVPLHLTRQNLFDRPHVEHRLAPIDVGHRRPERRVHLLRIAG